MTRLSFSGPLFQRGLSRELIDRAVAKTARYGRSVIAAKTPIDTERLKQGWQVVDKAIVNAVPYCAYVEDGTSRMVGRKMAASSIPAIEMRLEEELSQALKELG